LDGWKAFWLFIGGWALLQLAGIAWGRPKSAYFPTRYLDLTAVGLTANLAVLATGNLLARVERRAWTLLIGVSLLATTAGIFAVELPRRAGEERASLKNVQVYLATGDVDRLRGQPLNHLPIIWTDPEKLTPFLDDPAIRTLLLPTVASATSYETDVRLTRRILRFWWLPWLGFCVVAGWVWKRPRH
jgi:hypothetical protein